MAKVRLAGTLLVPAGSGPFPAVLLITGSGPQDRDESLLGHKPFLVLADVLARRGIAVLRVDDRGVGASTGTFGTATSEDFAGDALAGVSFLEGRKEIDKRHIGLVGHSEGGAIAPMVATRTKAVAFIVMWAGPGLPGDEILLSQTDPSNRARHRKLFDLVKAEHDPKELARRARPVLEAELVGADAHVVDAALAQLTSPWMRYFIAYDPRPTLAKMTCPVLALIGEKDTQVPPEQNIPAITAALK